MAAKQAKNTGKKRSTASSGRSGTSRNTKKNGKSTSGKTTQKIGGMEKTVNPMQREVVFLFVIVFAILAFLSCFNMCGMFGKLFGALLFGFFGALAYVFPVYLVIAVGFYISNSGQAPIRRKVIFSAFVFWFLCALFQWVVNDPVNHIVEIYKVCAENHSGGGLLGGLLSYSLSKLFGRGGSLIIILALFLLFFMLITGKLIFATLYQMYVERGDDEDYDESYIEFDNEEDYEYGEEEGTRKKRRGQKPKSKTFSDISVNQTRTQQPAMVTLEREDPGNGNEAKGKKKNKISGIAPTIDKSGMKELQMEQAEEVEEKVSDEILSAGKTKEKEADPFSGIRIFGAEDSEPEEKTPIFKEELDKKFGSKEIMDSDFASDQNETPSPALAEGGAPAKKKKAVITKEDEKEMAKIQADLEKAAVKEIPYEYPPLDLLTKPSSKKKGMSQEELKNTAMKLQETLDSFGVRVKMGDISVGPSVTRYELIPEQGVKVSRITGLSDDIKLSLAASDIRIEAPIPGKSAVGIEVPNATRSMVTLRELLESTEFQKAKSKVTFAVGKDISGQTIVTDIAKMPHLLVAGATGSGKSVLVNTLIMSILYKANPNEVKLIMVDPKMVELTAYEDIPHLMIPVVNDPKKASAALAWAVAEMTNRYQKFADAGVRNIGSYNERIDKVTNKDDPEFQKMPQIVIIVDEFADLMMVAPGEVEDAVCRLAQLARAAGIHLVLATQRPSVNVITGLIKANIPSRIALSVSSQIDSRTIINGAGAEKLLGNGDMLFAPNDSPKPVRVQGAFVSDDERDAVVGFLKSHSNGPAYNEEVTKHIDTTPVTGAGGGADGMPDAPDQDELFVQAGMFIIEKDKASIGLLQRMFRIGFNRAARIMDQLSDAGVVGPEEGTKARQILMSKEQFENYLEENG